MFARELLLLCLFCVAAQTIGSSDDRFIKKYAMMKIYESCFGPEVVKQIRKEMKEAYAKCSAPPTPPSDELTNWQKHIPPVLLGKLPPGFAFDRNTQTITKPQDGAVHNFDDHEMSGQEQNQGQPKPSQSPLGGIMAFKPQPSPFTQPQGSIPPYMMPSNPQYRPFSSPSPFYQLPYSAPGVFYPPNLGYNPYAYQQYQQFYQQPYYGSNRISRDMDLRERLDLPRAPPRLRNITCVMQELGYIDHTLEPNYEQITQRIANLPVSAELKGDIQDGLQFCQKFSQCVPDMKRNVAPLSQDLIKPMFFFRCYKHKKLEACIMKDIRERFTSEEELDDESDFRSFSRSARSIKEDPLNDPRFEALDEMAVYLYDYLSGGNSFDFDMYM